MFYMRYHLIIIHLKKILDFLHMKTDAAVFNCFSTALSHESGFWRIWCFHGGKSNGERKHIPSSSARNQTMEQTIVFYLLQKQKHPNFRNFLTPNILISPEEVQRVMYDAEYDILLCSNIIKLFEPVAHCLIPETLIIIWMVLHYRLICRGKMGHIFKFPEKFYFWLSSDWVGDRLSYWPPD